MENVEDPTATTEVLATSNKGETFYNVDNKQQATLNNIVSHLPTERVSREVEVNGPAIVETTAANEGDPISSDLEPDPRNVATGILSMDLKTSHLGLTMDTTGTQSPDLEPDPGDLGQEITVDPSVPHQDKSRSLRRILHHYPREMHAWPWTRKQEWRSRLESSQLPMHSAYG